MKLKNPFAVLSTVLLYLIVVRLLLGSFFYDRALPGIYRWLLAPAFLLAKDFFVFGQKRKVSAMKLYSTDRDKIQQDRNNGILPGWYQVALLVRKYVFPFFLIVYLLYLLIDQTQIWNLHVSTLFLVMNKGFLLTMTIVSGITMLFGEKYDKKYEKIILSKNAGMGYFILVCFLSAVGGYIILQQVLSLGIVGIIIANISVLLLFFVGLLLLEEEE